MASIDGDWSRAEVEEFLREALVPMRLGCHNPTGGLWMLSLWYRYDDGRLQCATSKAADVVEFLDADAEVCFEVSTNRPPYMGVRGAGEATIEEDGAKGLLRDLIERYLGTTDAEIARWLLRDEREEVRITVEPSRLHTWDYTPRMSDALDESPARRRADPPSPKYD